ncbi:Arabinose metabolism transcriptional repressor [bioreactor metagenome]|uniref:Arabinose metabolism transcriptional repressor n=1 Tax=bioreactor metagenome TaxID=1076179 RepID=A0A645BPH9_9ZZZZ
MKTHEVKKQLLKEFCNGQYRCGSSIPSEKELIKMFNISRSTLREAVGTLVAEGILERRQGSGTYLKKLEYGNNPLIGVIVSQISKEETIYVKLIQDLEQIFSDQGFSIVFGTHQENPILAQQQIERFSKLKVAGVILVPIMLPDMEEVNLGLVRMLNTMNLPFIFVDSPISVRTNTWYSCISVNHFQGMYQLVKYLTGLGHKHVAHIRGFHGVYTAEMRCAGYVEALRECGLPINSGYIREIRNRQVQIQGREEVRELMKLPVPPTAIACVHDLIAGNVIDELRLMGYRVPEDVAVTGFDDIPVPGIPYDFLTTMEQPVDEVAHAAANMILRKINSDAGGELQQGISCRLKIRHSCMQVAKKENMVLQE